MIVVRVKQPSLLRAEFARALVDYRAGRGLTQRALSKQANLDRNIVRRAEAQEHVSLEVLEQLAGTLGLKFAIVPINQIDTEQTKEG